MASTAIRFDRHDVGVRSYAVPSVPALSSDSGAMDALLRLWRDHEDRIEQIVTARCAHYRFLPQDCEDFRGEVKVQFFDPTRSPLLRIRDKASWDAYLNTVITNAARDFANKLFGKWRPTQLAARIGRWGIRVEMLLVRDRLSLEETVEIVLRESEGELSRRRIIRIVGQLPLRFRGRRVDIEAVDEPSTAVRADDALWETERRKALRVAAEAAVEAFSDLDEVDCLIMRLRHLDGFTLTRIGEEVGLSHQRVHERIKRGEARVRETLAREGIGHDDLFD